jgi:hypothetical protein
MSVGTPRLSCPMRTASSNPNATSASIQVPDGGQSTVITKTTTMPVCVLLSGNPATIVSVANELMELVSGVELPANSLISFPAAMLAGGFDSVLFTRGDGSYLRWQ